MNKNPSSPSVTKTLVLLSLISFSLPVLRGQDPPAKPAAEQPQAHSTKRIWARDLLWTDAPKFEVGQWLSKEPELEGKYILVEFWRTWCGACRRMSPRMNEIHRKYGDEIVVIAITGEPVDKVKAALPEWKKEYFLAIDKRRPQAAEKTKPPKDAPTPAGEDAPDVDGPCAPPDDSAFRSGEQGAYEAQFGVWGWPHVVLLDPKYRAVIWQGFPGLKGHELTVEKVGRYIERGRQADKEEAKE
jgi:thiol-disulfide isomerase/thioredoxin